MGAPSLLAGQSGLVLSLLNALAAWHYNHAEGGLVTDGGTTQPTGVSAAPNFDVDVSALVGVCDGVACELVAQTDADSDAGDGVDFGATSGFSCIFAVVLETGTDNDTPAIKGIAGAVAADGSEVAPTDAEIDTDLSHAHWVRLANVTLQRTGDTAVTVTIDNTVRPSVTAYSGNLATTESAYQSG